MGRKGLAVNTYRRGAAVLAAGLLTGGLAQTVVPSASAGAAAGNYGAKPTNSGGKTSSGATLVIRSSAKTGVVQTWPKVYLVEWGSQWNSDKTGAVAALQGLFQNLFVNSNDHWGPILDQYCEGIPAGTSNCQSGTPIHPNGSVYGGTYQDMGGLAPSKATTAQLAAEALKAATSFGDYSSNAQYVILSPSGTHPGGFTGKNFCGWHASTSIPAADGGGNLSYTNLPFVPDLGVGPCTTVSNPTLLDGYESTETHEFAESATDPFPSTGWLAGNGEEVGDLCVSLDAHETLGVGTYDVQGLWSDAAKGCVTSSS